MGPLVLVLMLLASGQLSQAALHISSSSQTSDSDRIAVQAALQDLLHTDSTHAGRGVTVSTKGVVLRESGRVRDPGDAPIRITSKPVNEAGQARFKPSWSNAGPEDAITPDALEPHYVSAPSGQPIYVHKVTYDQPHPANDDASAAAAAATTVRNMNQANDPAGQPWGEWNEWLDVRVLNGPAGQYGELSAVGSYGTYGLESLSAGGYGSRVSIASVGGSVSSAGASELDTVGADTKGSDTKGSDTKGSDTKGSDPVGASTAATTSSKSVREAGTSVSGTVGGVYEDPSDFSTSRKLLRKLLQTVSVGAIHVDVSKVAGKTAVDVAAPFTGVSVRKEEAGAAAAPSNTRALKQTVVDVGNLVHVDVTKLPGGKSAVNVLAPFTDVSVRKEEGATASPSSSNRRLLDDAKVSFNSQEEEEEAEQVEAEHVGDMLNSPKAVESHVPTDKATTSSNNKQKHNKSYPSPKKTYSNKKKTSDTSDDEDDGGEGEEDDKPSSPPAGGYYTKKGTGKKSDHHKGYSSPPPPPAGGYYTKKGTKAQSAPDTVKATASKVDTAGSDTKGADTKGADTKGADTAGTSSAAVSVAAAAAKPAAVKTFHFATADGEGTEVQPEGASGAPLSIKAAVAAAAVAAEDTKTAAAAAAQGQQQHSKDAASASVAAAANKGTTTTVQVAAAGKPASAAEPAKKASSSNSKPASDNGVGAVEATSEPKAAQPMFTKLTLTPKQIEEVKKMRAQMAASGQEDESEADSITALPLTSAAGAATSSSSKAAVSAMPAAAAAVKTAAVVKPKHMPGTEADTAAAEAQADSSEEEEDEDEDEQEDGEEEDSKDGKKAATEQNPAAKDQQKRPSASAVNSGSGDKKAPANNASSDSSTKAADSGSSKVAAGPAASNPALKPWSPADAPAATAKKGAQANAESTDTVEEEPEGKLMDSSSNTKKKDAPVDPFFNVVSRPKSPLAGLFGAIRPASILPRSSSGDSSPKSSSRKHGKHGKRGHKHAKDHDLNPEMPPVSSGYYPTAASHSKPDLPTAAGLSNKGGAVEGFKAATVSTASTAAPAAKVGIASVGSGSSNQGGAAAAEARPGQPFFFAAKEAGNRADAQAPAGSSSSSSSQAVPIEVARP